MQIIARLARDRLGAWFDVVLELPVTASLANHPPPFSPVHSDNLTHFPDASAC
jgi:hypothetical protein